MKVPGRKQTKDLPIRRLKPPSRVRLPLGGLEALVCAGDEVRAGSIVATSPPHGPWERRCHSPLTGRVSFLRDQLIVQGKPEPPAPLSPPPTGAVEGARAGGLVGMGGAMFPTYVKLQPQKPIDCVIVNGCESEPYVTCDTRVLAEHGDDVAAGLEMAVNAVGAGRGVIVREETAYPGGDERLLIARTLGRCVPEGGLPADVGAVVLNVQTVRALYRSVAERLPLTERVITVDGGAVDRPGNYVVPVGTEVGHVLACCGLDPSKAEVLLAGGPMMGRPAQPETPVVAGTVAVLALTADEVARPPETPCIRCGRCLDACPYGLAATLLVRRPTPAVLRCVGCGLCQFVCPAGRRLVSRLQKAKERIRSGRVGS